MTDLRTMFATMTPDEIRAASFDREIEEWKSVNSFCGKCGTPMRPHENPSERAFVCPSCGYTAYPKICPAVIVLVSKGDKVLLQRNSHYKTANWSLVAGFVDPGENLEEAVRREIREESSIEVKGIKVLAARMDGADAKALRETMDKVKDKLGTAVAVLAAVSAEGRVQLAAGVSRDLTDRVKAGELVNSVAQKLGGKGGGKPDMAMAGAQSAEGLDAALADVQAWVEAKL